MTDVEKPFKFNPRSAYNRIHPYRVTLQAMEANKNTGEASADLAWKIHELIKSEHHHTGVAIEAVWMVWDLLIQIVDDEVRRSKANE